MSKNLRHKMPKKEVIREHIKKIDKEYAELCETLPESQDLICSCCLGFAPRIERAHKIAVQLGGLNEISNFDLMCRHCHIASELIADKTLFIKKVREIPYEERPLMKYQLLKLGIMAEEFA